MDEGRPSQREVQEYAESYLPIVTRWLPSNYTVTVRVVKKIKGKVAEARYSSGDAKRTGTMAISMENLFDQEKEWQRILFTRMCHEQWHYYSADTQDALVNSGTEEKLVDQLTELAANAIEIVVDGVIDLMADMEFDRIMRSN